MRTLALLIALSTTAHADTSRGLTDGEVALLRPIFRDSIDYAHVTVIHAALPMQPDHTYMTPRGHIYAPGELWDPDFSRGDVDTRANFIHEMTHVWQFANGVDLITQSLVELTRTHGDYRLAYAYDLAPDRDLTDYGIEQQAAIVEDYYRVWVEKGDPIRANNPERATLYATILEKLMRDPRYARHQHM